MFHIGKGIKSGKLSGALPTTLEARVSGIARRLWQKISTCMMFGFPWYMPVSAEADTTMAWIRRTAKHQFGRGRHPLLRLGANIFAAISWPLGALIAIRRCRHMVEESDEARTNFKAHHAYWAALRHNIPPGEYILYRLWRPECWARRDDYLYSQEWAYVQGLFNKDTPNDAVQDKLSFYHHCKRHGLPTIPVLATVDEFGQLSMVGARTIPESDLFIKPRRGWQGHGAELWRWTGEAYETVATTLTREALAAHLANHGRQWHGSVVQPRLVNPPSLAQLTDGGLITIRIVTGQEPSGRVTPIFALIWIPAAGQVVSQFGQCQVIDLENGIVQQPDRPYSVAHWQSIVSAAMKGHASLTGYAFLGWDIASGPHGPVLVETNSGWSATDFQSVAGRPISLAKFRAIFEGDRHYQCC